MDIGTQLNRRNNPERGIRGVHVGLPRNSAGWLVYIPSTGRVLVSTDVVFDEDFLSTVSYTQSRIPGGLLHQPPSHPSFRPTHDVKITEDPRQYATNDDRPGTPHVSDTSDVFVGTPDCTFKVPMEEYFTDNLLPVVEGEESTTSSLTSFSSLSSTGRGP